jgi:hypothetical protein
MGNAKAVNHRDFAFCDRNRDCAAVDFSNCGWGIFTIGFLLFL